MIHSVIVCRDGSVESIKTYKDYFSAETYSNNLISKILKSIDFKFPNYRQGEFFTLDNLQIGVYTSELG
jgi:hypothetical protein